MFAFDVPFSNPFHPDQKWVILMTLKCHCQKHFKVIESGISFRASSRPMIPLIKAHKGEAETHTHTQTSIFRTYHLINSIVFFTSFKDIDKKKCI